MANTVYYSPLLKDTKVNATRAGHADFDSRGYAQMNASTALLVSAVGAQGAGRVDFEGTEEALTAGTVQTATTLSAMAIRNGAAESVINIYNKDTTGTLVFGPLTLAAGKERIIVFPSTIPATVFVDGVYVQVVSGALNATPGFLIP